MIRKLLLAALIAVPICYYLALIVGAATYPGYSHVTRYASELGAADAPWPAVFAAASFDGNRDGIQIRRSPRRAPLHCLLVSDAFELDLFVAI